MADRIYRPPRPPVFLNLSNLPSDPSPEFLKEVLRGNVQLVRPPGRPRVPPNIQAYLSWKEAFGKELPARQFVEAFRACSWRAVLLRVSLIGAVLANRTEEEDGPLAERLLREPLNRYQRNVNPIWARIAEYVADNPNRRVTHEQAIYLLAAMAILHGREDGPEPSPEHFGVMFLCANDHLSAWFEPDSRQLSDDEKLAAELIHITRFNTYPDPLRDLVRVNRLYSRPPEQGLLSDRATWSQVQTRAFGTTFEQFFSTFIMPVQFEMQRWGTENEEGFVVPVIEPLRWYVNTSVDPVVGKAFVEALTTTREEAHAELRARTADGIPHAPTLFIRKPLVRIDDQRVVAVSPWAVREHLTGGLYTSFSRVVNEQHDKEVWPSAFGNLFELYCRHVAELAKESTTFQGELVLSRAPGSSDEIEDMVIIEKTGCVLGSAKSRLVKEQVARQAQSRTGLLDWYDQFFFAQRQGRYQPGALRLLDQKIIEIRSGKHARIPADALIAPLLITFDNLGDNPMLARWISQRCKAEGLLCQSKVLPVVLAPVREFEVLMGLAAKGRSIIELLTVFARDREAHSNLNNFLHTVRTGENVRLAALEEEFDRVTEEAKRQLFRNP